MAEEDKTVTSEEEFRASYLVALDLDGEDEDTVKRRREAWRLALDIRKFEINLYWSRSQYFWAFQVAFFAALGFFISDPSRTGLAYFEQGSDVFMKLIVFAISLAGYISAISWVMIVKGSKRWQDNWERHVDMLEREFSGNIYKTYLGRRSELSTPPYSVSKINEHFSSFMVILWFPISALASYGVIVEVENIYLELLMVGFLFLAWPWPLYADLRMGDFGSIYSFFPVAENDVAHRKKRSMPEGYVVRRRSTPPGSSVTDRLPRQQ